MTDAWAARLVWFIVNFMTLSNKKRGFFLPTGQFRWENSGVQLHANSNEQIKEAQRRFMFFDILPGGWRSLLIQQQKELS